MGVDQPTAAAMKRGSKGMYSESRVNTEVDHKALLKTPRAPPKPAPRPAARAKPSVVLSWLSSFLASCVPVAIIMVAYNYWEFVVVHVAWLEPLALAPKAGLPRFSVLDFFGSSLVCLAYREQAAFPKSTLEALVACTLIQFGGTTVAHLCILGQPPSWLLSFTAWPAFLAAFWLTFCCPGDLFVRALLIARYTDYPLIAGSWIASAHAVTSWGMDKSLAADHSKASQSMICAILCGTLSASGGSLLQELASFYDGDMGFRRTPKSLRVPSLTIQRSFTAAVIYYVLIDPHGYLAPAVTAVTDALLSAVASAGELAADAGKRAAEAQNFVSALSGPLGRGSVGLAACSSYVAQGGAAALKLVGVWKEDRDAARAAVCVFIVATNLYARAWPSDDVLAPVFLPLRLFGVRARLNPKWPTSLGGKAPPPPKTPAKGTKID